MGGRRGGREEKEKERTDKILEPVKRLIVISVSYFQPLIEILSALVE